MRRSHYGLILALVLAVSTALAGCKSERKSSKASKATTPGAEAVETNATDNGEEGGAGKTGIVSYVERREGATPTSVTLASGGGAGFQPGMSWAFDPSSNGFFLVSAASRAHTTGGNVLRRIDLKGFPEEHDFNAFLDGKQGMHIMVPKEMRGAWSEKDFGGDGLFTGTICGLLPGPKKRIIALAINGAFVINPYVDDQAVTPDAVITFPHSFNVCEGEYSSKWHTLYATDVSRIESQSGQKGIFVVKIPEETGETVEADLFMVPSEYGFNSHSSNRFMDLSLYDDVLYLIEGSARFSGNYDTGIHRVPLNDAGEPLFAKATLVRTENPLIRAQGCTLNPDNTASGTVVQTGEKPILLVGGTTGVSAWDISDDPPVKVDLDLRRPGIQPFDMLPYGQGAPEIHYTPDGKHVVVMPHCRSANGTEEVGGSYSKVHVFRLAVLDLTGHTPVAKGNGIDISYIDFLRRIARDKKPSYLPTFTMSLRDIAVGPKHVAIVGAGKAGSSGLGASADMLIVDLKEEGPIPFTEPSDWRKAHEYNYGLKLGKDDPEFKGIEQSVHATIWLP